jgi:hypothetical protein
MRAVVRRVGPVPIGPPTLYYYRPRTCRILPSGSVQVRCPPDKQEDKERISPPPPHLLSGMTPSQLRLRKASVRPGWSAFPGPFFFLSFYSSLILFLPRCRLSLGVKALFPFGGGGGCMRQTTPKCKVWLWPPCGLPTASVHTSRA